jgi:hypothetical protein
MHLEYAFYEYGFVALTFRKNDPSCSISYFLF